MSTVEFQWPDAPEGVEPILTVLPLARPPVVGDYHALIAAGADNWREAGHRYIVLLKQVAQEEHL